MTTFTSSRNFGFDIDMDMDLIEHSKKRGKLTKFLLRNFLSHIFGNLWRRKILEKRQKENFIDRHFLPSHIHEKFPYFILHTGNKIFCS